MSTSTGIIAEGTSTSRQMLMVFGRDTPRKGYTANSMRCSFDDGGFEATSTFADRKGVALDVLCFTIDGARVDAEDTPKMLEMEDGNQIDVMMQQLGGGDDEGASSTASVSAAPGYPSGSLNITGGGSCYSSSCPLSGKRPITRNTCSGSLPCHR
jgi:hypothetical protein